MGHQGPRTRYRISAFLRDPRRSQACGESRSVRRHRVEECSCDVVLETHQDAVDGTLHRQLFDANHIAVVLNRSIIHWLLDAMLVEQLLILAKWGVPRPLDQSLKSTLLFAFLKRQPAPFFRERPVNELPYPSLIVGAK